METRIRTKLAVKTGGGAEPTGGCAYLESKSPKKFCAQPTRTKQSEETSYGHTSPRKLETENVESLPFKKRKVVGDWNEPPARVSTPAVPLPSDVTGGFVSAAESQSSVPVVRTQSWFDSEVNTETWDASLQPHYNLEFQPSVNPRYTAPTTKQSHLSEDPPFFSSASGKDGFNTVAGLIVRTKAKSSEGSLFILLPQSNKPTHEKLSQAGSFITSQRRNKRVDRQLKECLTLNNNVVAEKVNGSEERSDSGSGSKDEEPTYLSGSDTGRPSANAGLECHEWVEDQLGETLFTEGQNFRLKMPHPDPDFDPAKHRPMSTFQYFFDLSYWNQIAQLASMRQQQQLREDLFAAEMSVWKQNGMKSPAPERLGMEDCKRLVSKDNAITGDEVETFFGILLYMSIHKLPSYRMYWTGRSRVNAIANRMSRRKFDIIRSYLAIVDDVMVDGGTLFESVLQQDPFASVSPLLRRFQKQCAELPRYSDFLIGETQITSDDPVQPGLQIFTLRSQSGLVHEFTWNADSVKDVDTVDVMKKLLFNVPGKQFYSLSLRSSGFCVTGLLNEAQLDEGCKKLFGPPTKPLKQHGNLKGATLKDGSVYICRFSDQKRILTVASTHLKADPMVKTKGGQKPHCVVYATQTPRQETNVLVDLMMNMAHRECKADRLVIKILYWVIATAVTNCWLLEWKWKCMIIESYIDADKTLPSWSRLREPLLIYALRLAEEMMTLRNVSSLKLNVFGRRRVVAQPSHFDLSTVKLKEKRSGKSAPDPVPTDAVRLDGVCHIGTFNRDIKPLEISKQRPSGKSRKPFRLKQRRCGNPKCPATNPRTSFKCIKCGVYLCVLRDRNCFLEYHRTRSFSIPETDGKDGRVRKRLRNVIVTNRKCAGQSVDPEAAEGFIEPTKQPKNGEPKAKKCEVVETSQWSADENYDGDNDDDGDI